MLDHKPKKSDFVMYVMKNPLLITAGFFILISLLIMISVKDLRGAQENDTITLKVLFNEIVSSPNAGRLLADRALEILRNETDAEINLQYEEFKSANTTRDDIIQLISNQTPLDIITIDQIWLGELAQKGLLTDLTNYTEHQWDRNGEEEWYFENWEGGMYNGTAYGIWAWT
ncbi:MAG TPA: hypothetical protein VE130_09925, partial [Nitrososphaeraceae archaeon]|nr:hypothetical protein [Nitrososphaeraceae archaeon]